MALQQTGVITIDGPAGAGKTSAAQALAAHLGVAFLDTGAMYRALAVAVLDRGIDPDDAGAVADVASVIHIDFDWQSTPPTLLLDGQPVTDRLRDADVTRASSQVAVDGRVRQHLVAAQRRIGRERPGLVTEGRDQGSVVFPDATVKFYLDATPEIRAERRVQQSLQQGRTVDEAKVLTEIRERDHRDSTRADGPLTCPDDAVFIETADHPLEQVVEILHDRVEQALRERAAQPDDVSDVENA